MAYRKQLTYLVWLGPILAALSFALAFLTFDPSGEWIIKLISAALWFAVCVVALVFRRNPDAIPVGRALSPGKAVSLSATHWGTAALSSTV